MPSLRDIAAHCQRQEYAAADYQCHEDGVGG